MLRETQHFIFVLIFVLLIVALLTCFISFSITPPDEKEIPRRSRPVLAPLCRDEGYPTNKPIKYKLTAIVAVKIA